jgi:hypothetical protein
MKTKPFTLATVIFLALLAFVHVLRVALGWSVTVQGVDIPTWPSLVAIVIAAGLAYLLWQEAHS